MKEQLQESTAFFHQLVEASIKEAEELLFERANKSRNNIEQQKLLAAVAEIKGKAPQVLELALKPLASRLTHFGQPVVKPKAARQQVSLSLLSKQSQDESVILEDLAARAEARATLILFELGHRYAAMVGSPVFENNAQPFSPIVFCECLRNAIRILELTPEQKVIIYQLFSHKFLEGAFDFYNKINKHLCDYGMLPNLRIFALRKREQSEAKSRQYTAPTSPKEQEAAAEHAEGHQEIATKPQAISPFSTAPVTTEASQAIAAEAAVPSQQTATPIAFATPTRQPNTGQPATTSVQQQQANADQRNAERYQALSQLLSQQRDTVGAAEGQLHLVRPQTLNNVFSSLQQQPATVQSTNGELAPRNMHQLRQEMMDQLKQASPDGSIPAFTAEQTNAIDVMTMLFDRLTTSIKSNAGNYLLSELQVPLLRVAMEDETFFTQRTHPARNWLEKVALASSRWGADGDQSDHEVALITRIHSMNRAINREFDGNPAIFEGMAHDLQTQLEQLAHRASVAEKRSVEASRGRERLQLARKHAEELVKKRINQWQGSALTRKILQHAWTDVITLSLLRNGDNSEALHHHLQLLDMLTSVKKAKLSPAQIKKLSEAVKDAFEQAGMDSLEAELLANEAAGLTNEADSEKSQTTQQEIIQKIEQRRDSETDAVDKIIKSTNLKTNSKELEEKINYIKSLSFGAWFEFDLEDSKHPINRKLAWYSPRTGRCLFVNRHGIRTHETSIEHLAESMLSNKVRIAPPEPQGSFIERALDSIISGLKRLGGGAKTAQENPA